MTSERVLVVDDDPYLLSGLRRQLGETFDLTAATNGSDAVEAVRASMAVHDPYAVAVCDMRMPGMDGIETLRAIRDIAPDTVRIMLTGNAEQQTAMQAINEGSIFRFYTKPCPADQLRVGLQAGIDQYRLVTGERELLEKTLAGSLKVLVDALSMNDPAAYAVAVRLREWMRLVAGDLHLPQRWQIDVASALFGIGKLAIPSEIVARKNAGESLSELEQSLFDRVPEFGHNLLANIPRFGRVAEIIRLQDRGYDGSGFPPDGPAGDAIPIDARLLKILKDLAEACAGGPLTAAAFAVLDKHRSRYDPHLRARVKVSLEAALTAVPFSVAEIPVAALRVDHTLLSDLRLTNGHLILAANTQLTELMIERLRALRRMHSFAEPIKVRI